MIIGELFRMINDGFRLFLNDFFTSIIFYALLLIGFACLGKPSLRCLSNFRAISGFGHEGSSLRRDYQWCSKVRHPFGEFSEQFKYFVWREHRKEKFCHCCILDLS